MRSESCANAYDYLARMLILAKGLPLIAMVDVWESRGKKREISLVIREAPEQDVVERICADEVQDDEGLSGGWWNNKEQY